MGRCPWHGQVCNCGLGWPFPEDGKMPTRCEARTPLEMGQLYRNQFSDAKRQAYDKWVAAGMPPLGKDDED